MSKEIKFKKILDWVIFALIVLNITVFIFLSYKLYLRFDLTDGQKYSLSKPTSDLLKKLKSPLIIEYYYTDKCKEVKEMALIIQYIKDTLSEYERLGNHNVQTIVQELNYEKDAEKIDELQKTKGLQQFSLSEAGKTESKSLLGMSGIIIKYNNTEKVLGAVYSDTGFEFTMDSEISKLSGNTESIALLIASRIMNKQSETGDYKYVLQVLQNEYKDVKVLSSNDEIPSDINTLVILGGSGLTDYNIFQLDQFFMNGGKAFISLCGADIDITQQGIYGVPNDSKLIDLLANYGIRLNRDLVGDAGSFLPLQMQDGSVMKYPIWVNVKSENINRKNPIVKELGSIKTFWSSSIDINPKIQANTDVLFTTTKLAFSQDKDFKMMPQDMLSFIMSTTKQFNLGVSFNGNVDSFFKGKNAPDRVVTEANNTTKTIPYTGVKMDTGKVKLVVVSSEVFLKENFVSNDTLIFLMNSLDYISKDLSFIQIRDKGKFDMPLDKAENSDIKSNSINLIIGITTVGIPFIFIIIAILLYFRKKMKNKIILEKYK